MARYDYEPHYPDENHLFLAPFERDFDCKENTEWMQRNWHHSIWICGVYVIGIYALRKYMESRKPFSLETPLFWWNLSLSLFSIYGFIRMTPEWFWSWSENSFDYSICVASYTLGAPGYWCTLFAMSKVVELIDTLFIVLRKKPLLFLHWYHHCSVIIYTWYGYKDHMPSARWGIWMNFGIHSIMYGYYALRAAKIRVPKSVSMTVTVLQIAQMFIGMYVAGRIYYIKSTGGQCQQTDANMYFNIGIYVSYFLLFVHFFYNAYLKKNEKPKKEVDDGKKNTSEETSAVVQKALNSNPDVGTRRRRIPERI